MKQQISPSIIIAVVVVGIIVLAFVGYRTLNASPAPPTTGGTAEASNSTGAKGTSGLMRGGGGPPPEALQKRDEYNKSHPGAAGSR